MFTWDVVCWSKHEPVVYISTAYISYEKKIFLTAKIPCVCK